MVLGILQTEKIPDLVRAGTAARAQIGGNSGPPCAFLKRPHVHCRGETEHAHFTPVARGLCQIL